MGQDKASLLWRGQPLIAHTVQVAQQVTDASYIITPWPDRYRALVEAVFIQEPHPGQGPLVGLVQGLAALSSSRVATDWILLLACDLPYLEATGLHQWRSQLDTVPPNCLAVVPQIEERWEPLCAFYRPSILPKLEMAIAQGQRSFQAVLPSLPVQPLPLSPDTHRMLHNCNTPADWQAVLDGES